MTDAPKRLAGRRPVAFQLLSYALSIVLVAAALGLTLLLQGVVSTTAYIFFYAAVVASAWLGGQWPGILAVVLSTLTVEYFFLTPIHSFAIDRRSVPIFAEFAASSVIIGGFSSWRRKAEIELERARDELQLR